MNDRYLYRAKRKDNGEWIVGSLIQTSYLGSIRSWISSEQDDKARLREISSNQAVWRAFEVRTDTICQCTGLKDKNGNMIWENDIVNCFEAECCGKISWNESEAGFYFNVLYEDGKFEEEHIYDYVDCMKVIGNIFDNPELLEVGE